MDERGRRRAIYMLKVEGEGEFPWTKEQFWEHHVVLGDGLSI